MADGLSGIMGGCDGDSHHGGRAGGNHGPAERNGVCLAVFVFCYGDNELFGVFCFYGLLIFGLFLHCYCLPLVLYLWQENLS